MRSKGSLRKTKQRLVSFVCPPFHQLSVLENFNLYVSEQQQQRRLPVFFVFFFTLSSDKWTLVVISPLSSYSPALRLEFHVSNQRLTRSHQSQQISSFFNLYFPPTCCKMIIFTQ